MYDFSETECYFITCDSIRMPIVMVAVRFSEEDIIFSTVDSAYTFANIEINKQITME